MKITTLLETMTTTSSDPASNQSQQAPKFGRDPKVLENDDKLDETTSGAISTGEPTNLGVQRRGKGSMFQGIKTSKKFSNSAAVKEGVAEGWKGELAGGTIGGIAGNLAGSALGGPLGGIVGGAVGGAGGGIIGRELTKEEQLNEFAPILAAGARLVIAMAPKISQVLKSTGKATVKAAAPVAKSGAEITAKNAGQIGLGLGAYEIGSSVADIAKDITAKVGTALEEKTVMELAQVAFKFAIPAGIVLAILYGGKKVIDSLFSNSNQQQGVAEADELRARGGLASVNKKPRIGQTDMRNIPVGNHPDARINKFTDKDRAEHPSRLKAKIKSTLGKHTRPNLPEQGVAESSWNRDPEQDQMDANRRGALSREREPQGSDKIDTMLAQRNAQLQKYNETGKFWLKKKDSQEHVSNAYVGKAAANQAAIELLKQNPELKGNIVITAWGPGETPMNEAELSEEQILAKDLKKQLELFKKAVDNDLGSKPNDKELGKKPKDKEVQKK